VAIAANGGLGSVTSLFARGGESDFTLVMVDGVKLNSFGGGFDFGHLTTAGLSSLEVVRGPQSAVFGADAIGGVVQVRTAIGGPASAEARFETGSLGTNRFVAGTTGSRGVVAWGAHVERLASDGWTAAAPGTNTPVSNDDYEGTNVSLGASWKASRGTVVRANGRFSRNERGNPGPFGSNPIGAFFGIDTVSRGKNDLALASVAVTHEWNPRTAVRFQGSWMRQDSDFASMWGASMARTRRWTAHAQADRAFGAAVSTSFGVDADVEQADNTFITGISGSEIPVDRHTVGYFGEARIRGGSRLLVTAGLRLDHIVREALEADPSAFTPRPPLPADAILSPNPRIAVSYDVRPASASGGATRSRVHASAGTGIRTPDAFEIAFTDNPGLKPERSRSVDVGFEQTFIDDRLIVDGTAFLNDYDQLIVAVGRLFAGSSRYRTDNIANARARGFEGSATWRTAFGLEARTAYTFVDSDVLAVDRADGTAPPPFSVGDPLIRRPRHQASADVLLTRGRWTAHARAAGRGRVLDVEPNYGAFGGLFQAAGFTVVDASASARLGHSVEVLVRANNVFDRHYESVFGYPSPGRTFTVGVRLVTGR
jgi:outer membrane cobalamin receptor